MVTAAASAAIAASARRLSTTVELVEGLANGTVQDAVEDKAPPTSQFPDGGYGWVIVGAFSLNQVLIVQILAVFGLLFKDRFRDLQMTGTDLSTIMNLNISFSLMLGIFSGAMIRSFGYRKVAAVGAVFACAGMVLTSFASSFVEFLIYYGIITSTGLGLTVPAYHVALNSYFRARRSLASGVALTITGMSSILMPQLVSLLLRQFGSTGSSLIFAGLALNGLVAASLMQPVAWHRPRHRAHRAHRGAQPPPRPQQGVPEPDEGHADDERTAPCEPLPVLPEETDSDLMEAAEAGWMGLGLRRRSSSTSSSYYTARRQSEGNSTLWASASVLDLGCSVFTLSEPIPEETELPSRESSEKYTLVPVEDRKYPGEVRVEPSRPRRWLKSVVAFLDLGLLKKPTMVNLMLGISLAFFAEMNFMQFTPFILAERDLDTQQIATLMSVIAIVDTASRFAAPFVHKLAGLSSLAMYVVSLSMLAAARLALVLVRDPAYLIPIMVGLGVSKGHRSVFYSLIIPDNVPLERLASALGLQAVINGIIFFALGPLIGYIRDTTASYDLVIIACNGFTLLTICMWLAEFAIKAVAGNGKRQWKGREA